MSRLSALLRRKIGVHPKLQGLLRREEITVKHLVAGAVIGFLVASAVGVGASRTVFVQKTAAVYQNTFSSYSTGKVADCSWGCPSASSLKAAGYRGVMSYLSYDTGKDWSPARLTDVRSHGLAAGFNWESTADRALYGYSAGQSDARQAQTEENALGVSTPVYFSVDIDATESQQCAIDSYFAGADSVLGSSRVGAYADWFVLYRNVSGGCLGLSESGHINYRWQTYAWSGLAYSSSDELYQYSNGLLGGSIDADQVNSAWGALLPDGNLLTHGYVAPPPPPAPTSSPSPPPPPSCGFGTSGWSLKPWPNGSGAQSLTVYQAGGSLACSNPRLSYGLQWVNKYTGRRYNVSWDPWTTQRSDLWNLNYYTTPCSDGYRVYHFMVALRSGGGAIAAYRQVGSFAINSACA